MMKAPAQTESRAGQLRREFDLAFARPCATAAENEEGFLAIRMRREIAALRLGEIAGLFAAKAITQVPDAAGALLGLAAFRGAVRPVFDLQYLLCGTPGATPRFLIVASAEPVAFGFEALDGQIAVAKSGIAPLQGGAQAFANEFIKAGGAARPIIHLPALIDAIRSDRRRAS